MDADLQAARDALWAELAADFAATAARTGVAALPPQVAQVLHALPRERFVAPSLRDQAYANRPLPIGHGQTISQPFIVALMTTLLAPQPGDRVLELGTGCGYQTALLAALAHSVVSVERVPALAAQAAATLHELGVRNVQLQVGDGLQGWPAGAPYARILAAASPPDVPPALLQQLAPGGRLVMPVGSSDEQVLRVVDRFPTGELRMHDVLGVRFVPMLPGLARDDD